MRPKARLAQLVQCKALNLVVVGSSPTMGEDFLDVYLIQIKLEFKLIYQGRLPEISKRWHVLSALDAKTYGKLEHCARRESDPGHKHGRLV